MREVLMIATWLAKIVLLSCCALCLMGVQSSVPRVFEVRVPLYPWQELGYPLGEHSMWDEEAKLGDLGITKLYDWQEVFAKASAYSGEAATLRYELEDITRFLRKNIFVLLRPGIVSHWQPEYWDLDFSRSDDTSIDIPNAIAIKKLLTDPAREKDRKEVLRICLELVNSQGMKDSWKLQQAMFINGQGDYVNSMDDFMYNDYVAMSKATYAQALNKAADYYLGILTSVRHQERVMYSDHAHWIITRVINDICYFYNDESAFKFYSLCYRLGPDGAGKLKSYVEEAKKGLRPPN